MRERWQTVCDGRKFWSPHFEVPRKCTQSGYDVVAGGTSKYADCVKLHTQAAVYQCCKPN